MVLGEYRVKETSNSYLDDSIESETSKIVYVHMWFVFTGFQMNLFEVLLLLLFFCQGLVAGITTHEVEITSRDPLSWFLTGVEGFLLLFHES